MSINDVIDDTPEDKSNIVIEPVIDNIVIEDTDSKETEVAKKHQNVIQDYPIDSSVKLTDIETVVLPSHFPDETGKALQAMPNISIADNEKSKLWGETIREGLEAGTFREVLKEALTQDNEEYRQHNEINNISLEAQIPKYKPIENQNLTGERALLRMISHLGLGSLFQVPLWHSGFWITFKPPTESEIIELNRLIMSDKINFGRFAYGLLHSNTTVFTVDRLVDFALSHVYDTSIKPESFDLNKLKDIISSQDIDTLLWGFICTMYPQGFNYSRACVADPEKCNFVINETINVTKLQWTSVSSLTDWQKTHMASRQPKTKDIESIKRYKDELSKIQDKKITISKGEEKEINIVIKTPTISEYIESGYRWINDIVNTVDKSVGQDTNIKERNSLINRYGQAAAMRQYIHWIKSLEYSTNIIDDKETIEIVVSSLSSDNVVYEEFIKQVVDYINKSTISVIGIPVFDCPSCGKTQESKIELPIFTNIIPLDVKSIFFELHTQKLSRLMER